jgi:hypothetical protein
VAPFAKAGLVGWPYNERTAQHAYRSWWSSGSDDRVVAGWFVYPSRRPTDESQTNGEGYVRSHACGPQQGPRRFGRHVEPWSRTHASEVASPFRDRYGSPSRERRIATTGYERRAGTCDGALLARACSHAPVSSLACGAPRPGSRASAEAREAWRAVTSSDLCRLCPSGR